jgi:DNA replication protein DnaC
VYEYKFEKENCWYKNQCPKFNNEHCNASCIRYMEIDFLMYESRIPKNRQLPSVLNAEKVDYKAFIELNNIKENILDFTEKGGNLYIFSENFGNGKTSWAIKIMLKLFNDVWAGNGFKVRGLFIHVPSFLVQLKENIRREKSGFSEFLSNIEKVDLVIWDDIASTKLSEYDHCNLLTYIDSRMLSQYSNIYTGNFAKDELIENIGNRLASRVWGSSKIIELKSNDKRGL